MIAQLQASVQDSRISFDGRLASPGRRHGAPVYSIGNNRLRMLETTTGSQAVSEFLLPGSLVDSAVCGDNRSVAAVSVKGETGWLSVSDVATGRSLFPARTLPHPPCSVAARPGSFQVAVLCTGGELLVLDSRSGDLVKELRRRRNGEGCGH